MTGREVASWAAAVAGLGALAIAALAIGAVTVPPAEIARVLLGLGTPDSTARAVILSIRLPRVVLAVAVGGTLAATGAAVQAALRNPLADPGLLGVSSGAACGAATAIAAGWGGLALPACAFVGAIAATAVAAGLGRSDGYGARLLLAGVAVNALAGAGIGLALFLADDAQVRSFTFWSLGSLAAADRPAVGLALAVGAAVVIALIRLAPPLDALALGERDAAQLGVDVPRMRRSVALWTALGVATCVAATGGIGFIGLVVPHLVAGFVGQRQTVRVPAAGLVGAGLLLCADLLARTLAAPAELPVGVVTALLGAPVFAWLVARGGEVIALAGGTVVRSGRRLIADATLEVRGGELVALIGPNGAGKSTLLAALAGTLALDAGELTLDGAPVRARSSTELARIRAVVTQRDDARDDLLAADVVALGRLPWGGAMPWDPLVLDALAAAQAGPLAGRSLRTLSGGERQRVHLARAFAQVTGTPRAALLLDEPTSAQDLGAQDRLLAAIRRKADEGAAVVLVLHDVNLASAWCDRLVCLAGGRIVAQGAPAQVVGPDVLRRAFGVDFHVFPHPVHGRPQTVTATSGGSRP